MGESGRWPGGASAEEPRDGQGRPEQAGCPYGSVEYPAMGTGTWSAGRGVPSARAGGLMKGHLSDDRGFHGSTAIVRSKMLAQSSEFGDGFSGSEPVDYLVRHGALAETNHLWRRRFA